MSWYSEVKIWAESLEAQWSKSRAEGMEFSRFATEAMKGHTFHQNFNLEAEIKTILEASEYPHQVHPLSTFGDPPITLHFSQDKSFYLDLYIWMSSHTSIHQHTFEGAFTVLQGTSLESDYEFKAEHALGPSWIGKLEKKALRKLSPGEIRTIFLKDKMVHRVLHLSKPTVSLVLRTHLSSPGEVQFNYDFDVLANNSHPEPDIKGKLRVLNWYLSSGQVPTYKMIEPLLPYADLWNLLAGHQHSHGMLKKMGFLTSESTILEGMSKQQLFLNIFHALKTEEEKILFTAYEFFGESWTEWIQKTIQMDPKIARDKLQKSLDTNPVVNDVTKRSPLLKALY